MATIDKITLPDGSSFDVKDNSGTKSSHLHNAADIDPSLKAGAFKEVLSNLNYDTASGAIASFDDGGDGKAVKSLKIEINPVQSGTGDPSPDNVRPISGWTGAEVTNKDDMTNPTVTRTYPISFESAGTVYGGYLQVDEDGVCKLVGSHSIIEFDGSEDEDFNNYGGDTYKGFSIRITDMTSGSSQVGKSNRFIVSGFGSGARIVLGASNNICYFLHIKDTIDGVIDVTSWKSWIADNPTQVWYPLAEPIEITLPDTVNITTLLGNNNIYADTGDVDVVYIKDLSDDDDIKLPTVQAVEELIQSHAETDPTVPSWAKASTKPSYNFSEIGSKPTTISGYGITDAYTKTQVDGLVAGVLHYKGTKATVANLPTSGNTTGDVWHITADGSEWAWDGSTWQELGTAVDLSSYALKSEVPGSAATAVTGITIADHTTSSITGVQSSTTSVTGVSGSTTVRGVKTGTNSTTTASYVKSGGNGTAPTLGTAISIYGVKSGTDSTTTASHVKSGSNGTAPTLGTAISIPQYTFSNITVPIKAISATTVPIKDTSATSIPNVTAVGSGSASLTMTMDSTDTKKLNIAFSHTHTPPTLGTAISIIGVQSGTTSVTGVQSSTTTASKATAGTAISVPNVTSVGSASNWVFEDVTVPIRADAATSIPNVTSVGSASNWTFEDIIVPIRADSDTTVPVAATSATTVPIKNASATTVVTGKSHSITDPGHSHSLS